MQHNKYTKQFIFFISFIIIFPFFQTSAHAQSEAPKSVFILNSYGNDSSIISGYRSVEWTSEIISSINSQFISSKENVDVKIQYMDSYFDSEEEYWQQLYSIYRYKFKNHKFDVVVALDDNAFNFLRKYGDTLFPNTPVVFSGVNNFNKSMISEYPLFTGLTKSRDIQGTIELALKLHPDAKQVFIITDNKRESIIKEALENVIPLYDGKLNFVFCNDENITKVKEKVENLPKDAVIYFDGRLKDDMGKEISVSQTADILFQNIDIPSYSKKYVQLNDDSIGGIVTFGNDLGKEIGNIVLRILNGEKVSNIPVTEDSSHRYVFNYEKLKKFNIDLKALPEGAEIINAPAKSYNVSKRLLLYAGYISALIIGIASIFLYLNIYKRKLAERLLSENESLLRTLINSTPDIIYFKSPEGKFLEVNNTALSLLNINEKYHKSKKVNELENVYGHAKDILTKWNDKDDKAWETGTLYRNEEVILDEKEKVNKIYDNLRIPLFHSDGTRKGMILLGRDVTEHKQVEENEKLIKDLLNYDKLKTNFFSNISHEFKTPLNLIFSTLQVIELKTSMIKEEDKSVAKYIGIMRQNCYRLLRIINNLIDITKIDAGHFFTHFQNKDIVNVIENIVLSVADYVESKGISIVFDTEIEEKVIPFDPDAMERIILNLLSNAIKFTPSGGSIEVNIYDKVDSIEVSVKDTGIGITTENKSSIFQKFIQVDKSFTRNREGSGIGLSLVKELVAIHNGSIELESTPGKGSEFKIILPVKPLIEEKDSGEFNLYTGEDKVERIKIEFSDIYN